MSMFNEIDPNAVSRDPEVVHAYIEDPLRHDRISASFAISMLDAGLDILGKADDFPIPLLLMVGGSDSLVSVDACREFDAAAGENCTLRVWDGLYHEVHNEPEQEQVLSFAQGWMAARV
jgi:alpha-beta hydrolase superfamily lysophospholipase